MRWSACKKRSTAMFIGFILALASLASLAILSSCPAAQADSISWIYSYEEALKLAAQQNKPIMAGFYTTWCSWCKKLDTVTYADSAVAAASKDFICLKVDAEKRRDVAQGYGVGTLPTILFLDPLGRIIWKEFGYRDPYTLSGRMREVLAYFKKSTIAEPYIRSAFDEASRGNPDRGISVLDSAISSYSDDSRLYAARGAIYRYKGDLDGALRDIDKAISLNPKADELYNMRGMVYYEKKDPARAMADYDKAISLNRWAYEAYNSRGVIYMDRSDPDAAIKNFNTAVLINPRNPGAYLNRGVAYLYKGELSKSLADLDAAVKLDPRMPNAYSARAALYMKLGQYEKSWQDVRAVEKIGYKMKPEFIAQLQRLSGRER